MKNLVLTVALFSTACVGTVSNPPKDLDLVTEVSVAFCEHHGRCSALDETVDDCVERNQVALCGYSPDCDAVSSGVLEDYANSCVQALSELTCTTLGFELPSSCSHFLVELSE